MHVGIKLSNCDGGLRGKGASDLALGYGLLLPLLLLGNALLVVLLQALKPLILSGSGQQNWRLVIAMSRQMAVGRSPPLLLPLLPVPPRMEIAGPTRTFL